MKKNQGITLIALVVTIVVLLILAGITITYVMRDNGIFKQATDAKTQTEIAKLRERIELVKTDWWLEKKIEPSIDIDDFWDKLIKEDVLGSKDDVKGPEAEGEKDKYIITTPDGYIVEIIVGPNEANVEIGEIIKGDSLPPKVQNIEVINKTSNSIEIKVEALRLEDGKLSYYYKKESETEYHELADKIKVTDLIATYTGLEQNQIYNIKVVAENKKGKGEKVINVLTGELETGVISQKGETTWENNKASIELETTNTNLTLKYQIGGIDDDKWLPYNGPIGNLNHDDTVYAVLTDGNNYGEVATVVIRDGEIPTATISNLIENVNIGANITASVLHQDNESGVKIGECKWVFTESNTKIGTVANNYTGGTFSSNEENITWSTTIPGIYYLHVLTVDNAGNKEETVSSSSVTVRQLATSITVNPTTVSIVEGKTQQLTGTVLPENTYNKTITWTSSNEAVAKVSNTGLVTAVQEGTVTITATTADGSNRTAKCSVNIRKPKIEDIVGQIQEVNKSIEDKYGNKIVIPGGFKVVPNGGTDTALKVDYTYNGDGTPAVQDGIVIEDEKGNQFVWIPVGSVKNKDNTTTTITLGRYTFNRSNGTPTLQQDATNYSKPVVIQNYYEELPSNYSNTGNTLAKNLGGFIRQVRLKGGYYLARYEASGYGSVPMSKANQNPRTGIRQPEAALVARAMYDTTSKVESDLINSYSWDTAIVFIQKYSGNSNYANKTSVNSDDAKTGESGDKVCNIHDMASNCYEWSTETSNDVGDTGYGPCVGRGGSIYTNDNYYTAFRQRDFPVTGR